MRRTAASSSSNRGMGTDPLRGASAPPPHSHRHAHAVNRYGAARTGNNHHHHRVTIPHPSSSSTSHQLKGLCDLKSQSPPSSTLVAFYQADDELNVITAELDSFDGRKDPIRCTNLVNQLRSAQDKVICLLFQLMDEWKCIRADRDYRLKFPDDLVSGGENGESLNGQIWFGAECLASGSNILNHETESELLRPMAKLLTNTLEQLRLELRHGINNHGASSASSSSSDRHHSGINNSFRPFPSHGPSHANASNSTSTINLVCIHPSLKHRLESFDILFAEFEYEYVKAMLPIKTAEEIEKLHEVTALFSESVAYSLKKGLISQDDIEECTPHVLIVIPRLAILYALVHCPGETAILRKLKSSRRDSSGAVCSMLNPITPFSLELGNLQHPFVPSRWMF